MFMAGLLMMLLMCLRTRGSHIFAFFLTEGDMAEKLDIRAGVYFPNMTL